MSVADSQLRLCVYQHFADTARAPSPVENAVHFGLAPGEVGHAIRRLGRACPASEEPVHLDGRAIALDDQGVIYQYHFNAKTWVRLNYES